MKPSPTHLKRLPNHLDWLDAVVVHEAALQDLLPAFIRHFATEEKVLLVHSLWVGQAGHAPGVLVPTDAHPHLRRPRGDVLQADGGDGQEQHRYKERHGSLLSAYL
jgi:hypothetical protein